MSFLDPHDTPAIDAFFADIERLRKSAFLLEEVWRATEGGYAFPDARVPPRQVWSANHLKKAMEDAIETGVEGGDLQAVLQILNDALVPENIKPTKQDSEALEKSEQARRLLSRMQDHFGFDDSE